MRGLAMKEPVTGLYVIGWLLSSEQGWVTGQILHVDGGLSTVQAR
jgi:NAD(P)-dependent dehydrogenase (short-subunit alcohol dehydrogenase family)